MLIISCPSLFVRCFPKEGSLTSPEGWKCLRACLNGETRRLYNSTIERRYYSVAANPIFMVCTSGVDIVEFTRGAPIAPSAFSRK